MDGGSDGTCLSKGSHIRCSPDKGKKRGVAGSFSLFTVMSSLSPPLAPRVWRMTRWTELDKRTLGDCTF